MPAAAQEGNDEPMCNQPRTVWLVRPINSNRTSAMQSTTTISTPRRGRRFAPNAFAASLAFGDVCSCMLY